MKISVSKQRAIAQHLDRGMSVENIAFFLGISQTTVRAFQKILLASGLTYQEDLTLLDDMSFAERLGTKSPRPSKSIKIIPHWHYLVGELNKPNVTLALLWQEYLLCHKDTPGKCLSYSQFQRRFREWRQTQRISMRQFYAPGEKMFVDFCGKTVPITNADTGEVTFAQVFVAVLGGSSYTFAYAVEAQKSNDWIRCHMEAFKYFGGVPQQVVPDNLKAAVIKNTKYELIVNKAYEDCSAHYNFIICPARVRKPKDKSLAEVGVQLVQRWILAGLRNRKFFSLEELNNEIRKGVELLNAKESKVYSKSRLQRFLEVDKLALQPLPEHEYDLSSWIYNVKIPDDYHVIYNGSFYSVPYQYRFNIVDLRITSRTIEILLGHHRIACHVLRSTHGMCTIPDHMPEAHRHQVEYGNSALLEWAESISPNVKMWVQQWLTGPKATPNTSRTAKHFRSWARQEQNYDALDLACAFALHHDIMCFQSLKSIVSHQCYLRHNDINPDNPNPRHDNLRGPQYYIGEDDDVE